ncbi:MAG: rhodanese-like domain-containing protein [Planctomycetota bacterium]
MSTNLHKAIRACFGASTFPVLAVVLMTLSIAGCSKPSEEPTDTRLSTVALAADSPPEGRDDAAQPVDGPSRTSVFYLFNTFRCAACKKVESLTKEAVLGTQEEPSPFADEIAAATLTFETLNIEEKQHEHFLTDFGTQAKIPVIAEMSGQRIVRFVVLDKAWFLFDDKPRYLDYVRGAIEAFNKNEEPVKAELPDQCEYITALAAYEKAQNAPKEFHILDIRTPEEYVFIGHPEGARNIPVMFMGYSYDEKMGRQKMLPNADFAEEVQQHYSPEDHLAILGESGPRAALAVRMLSKAGFKHLYAITHGFVGEMQGQAEYPDHGKRRVNGWVNEGVPWTTSLVPELMYERQEEIADR